jgi:starch synthase
MSLKNAKVLTISQFINPSRWHGMAKAARQLPQGMLDRKAMRSGCSCQVRLHQRARHQLHEVIRLSGMNLIINDTDHALLIKVASVPSARMQVYFIDNEEYFKRKAVTHDVNEDFYPDNDERALFFCRACWKPCASWAGARTSSTATAG